MSDFRGSTLWPIGEYERLRERSEGTPSIHGGGAALLPTTLLNDLRQLQSDGTEGDLLEVMAACMRHREAVLLYIEYGPFVWPVTLFPRQRLYHSPQDVSALSAATGLAGLKLLSVERAGIQPPGAAVQEGAAGLAKYRSLAQLLWTVALHGPRRRLLKEIGGHAAYRLAPQPDRPVPPGALSPAVLRLRERAASLKDIAQWPGMSVERASRLLNALYLTDALMVTRSNPAARDEPLSWRSLFSQRR